MIRSFFLAVGVFALILGAECLVLDRAVLAPSREASMEGFADRIAPAGRDVTPAEWAPWSLLSGGAVTILYSFTLVGSAKAA